MKTVTLSDSVEMPVIGLGTWEIKDSKILYDIIDAALQCGYRFFDTATAYKNERTIGKVLRDLLPKYGLKREDIFITSKLHTTDQGKERARNAGLASIAELGLDYIDLYLIHFPGCSGLRPTDPENRTRRKESWLELERLKGECKFREIGVANYTQKHLDDLMTYASVKPVLNQVEFHPFYADDKLVGHCKQLGVHFQAYSSLGSAHSHQALLKDPLILGIAEKNSISTAQLLLAWALNQGISVLPKTTNRGHVADNFGAADIDLNVEDILKIATLSRTCGMKKYCWDPSSVV